MSNVPFCQGCQRPVPAKYCEFTQGIGMLVIRTSRGVKGNLCRECSSKYFWQMTCLTLVTGWWGLISFVMNIVYIISNIVYYVGSRSLPDSRSQGFPVQQDVPPAVRPAGQQVVQVDPNAALAGFRNDIALRLRGGQSPLQIAQYIAPRSGLNVQAVERYVREVASNQSQGSGNLR